ncbi:MAG: hypothetical protein WA071_05455 [Undibacterium umbellatum]|uniref:hypothetical protein n=1 Tax=Undibacterium umbellatum TaxID=2762300 RepID=UPI003BB5BCBD
MQSQSTRSKFSMIDHSTAATGADRFDDFIRKYSPGGHQGISVHSANFERNAPYFEWATSLLAGGDNISRSWFLKEEFLSKGREVFTRVRLGKEPKIINPRGLIEPGRFLSFAKAYVNVITYEKKIRSTPKALILSISYIEKALRYLNKNINDPSNLNLKSFEIAHRAIQESSHGQSKKYDIAKELEIMACVLQDGYKSKNMHTRLTGFNLLNSPFQFRSMIASSSRPLLKNPVFPSKKESQVENRITSEEIVAVGLAYRKAISQCGAKSPSAFFSALLGLAFTTVSMRISELICLRRDAIYKSENDLSRTRIRISRPKIDSHQDIPISKKLAPLATEIFQTALDYSQEAHLAFKYYIERYPHDFNSIDELYIPLRLKQFFSKKYLSLEDARKIFSVPETAQVFSQRFSQGFGNLEKLQFVKRPGDISPLVSFGTSKITRLVTLKQLIHFCKDNEIIFRSRPCGEMDKYISILVATRMLLGSDVALKKKLKPLFDKGIAGSIYIKSADLKAHLLNDFKKLKFPHWPYVSKDRHVKLDEALAVWFHPSPANDVGAGEEKGMWWKPENLTPIAIGFRISYVGKAPPALFLKLGIKLRSGLYPSFSLHQARKYHQTNALLAGANILFVDELAGRKTGSQSDFYDLRTPHEILIQSIDTFDPDDNYEVVGPIASALEQVKLVDRSAFLFDKAVPKHITEIGGCVTDWSINPCEQFGECTNCDKQVWMKGDKKRLSTIVEKRKHAIAMIKIAKKKKKDGNTSLSLVRQYQQFNADLIRCNEILAYEKNPEIAAGTLVTFSSLVQPLSVTELVMKLSAENREIEKRK